MSHATKKHVLDFLIQEFELKELQFNEALKLYCASEGKSFQLERRLNQSGYSPSALDNLIYDLKLLHEISDLEVENHKVNQIDVAAEEVSNENLENVTPNNDADKSADSNFFEPFLLSITSEPYADELAKVFEEESVKFREEFPFLNEKDCPEILYVVVGKRISAFKAWQIAIKKLSLIEGSEDAATKTEETTALAKEAEENFQENRALWEELDHYKQTGEILGKHDLFWKANAEKKVKAMTTDQLVRYKNSSATYISKKNKALQDLKNNPEKAAEINKDIEVRTYELELVNQKLGVTSAK